VTIRVPRRASAGERYGVVWAEVASPPAPGGAVSVVNRVGIRMYLSVGPGGEPASDFRIESLSATRAADGRPMVTAYVRNTGGRALDVTGSLVLADGPGGLSAGPFPAQLGTTLALGDTKPVAVLLDRRLPEGPWRARIALHSGFVKRVSEATLVFPGPGDVALGGSKQRRLNVAVVAGVALPCLLALWLIAHLSRRLRRRRGVG
jgi:hypothetical protein